MQLNWIYFTFIRIPSHKNICGIFSDGCILGGGTLGEGILGTCIMTRIRFMIIKYILYILKLDKSLTIDNYRYCAVQ